MPTEDNYSLLLLKETLPPYVVASPPPSYSCNPTCGEERIEHTPRAREARPTGAFIKKNGSVTVVLHDQEDGATVPTFGRQSKVNGILLLDKYELVSQVTLKLTGHLDYLNSAGGSTSVQTVQQNLTVWSTRNSCGDICPESLPFTLSFPATYQDGGNSVQLPPSFIVSGAPGIMVTSVYTLAVHVSFARRNVAFISKNKTLRIPLNYHPRTRPNRPIIPVPLFCGLKSSPEEWFQSIIDMKVKTNMIVTPVHINTIIPSAQIFAISDVIPFHIQLSGSLSSLQKILPSSATSPITVTLLRQITTLVHGSRAWRNITVGEGKIWPVPPSTSQLASPPSEDEVLDWEGEIQCNADVCVGGFSASGVAVKDFLHIVLRPPPNSPFLSTQQYVPLRLVTDPWVDSPDRA